MNVQKTFSHEGRTIEHGTFLVRETVYVCAARCRNDDGSLSTKRARSVTQVIMPNSITGYDLMVFVGIKRLLENRQREEIKDQLSDEHGIKISSGEVSNLTNRFLDYLLRLHYARSDQLKAALEIDGGWPMHVDATGENGRGTLFVVMAGWKKWCLGPGRLLPNEKISYCHVCKILSADSDRLVQQCVIWGVRYLRLLTILRPNWS